MGVSAGADVLIENMRRGALEKLSLGYEGLKEVNPGLVYCSITGFGPGEDEERPGYDFLVQARGGIMSITGFPDGEPTKVGVAIADMVCGLQAAMAVRSPDCPSFPCGSSILRPSCASISGPRGRRSSASLLRNSSSLSYP